MINLYDCEPLKLMPEVFRSDEQVEAMSYAFGQTIRMLLGKIDSAAVYAGIDILPEQIVDLLAEEFRAQYYDTSLPVTEKRKAVKKALLWHSRSGTVSAVRELTDLVWRSESAQVQEWFEYGAAPYLFRVMLETDMGIEEDKIEDFIAALWKVKNTRSHLEAIAFRRKCCQTLYIGSAIRSTGHIIITDVWNGRYDMRGEMHFGAVTSNVYRIKIREE